MRSLEWRGSLAALSPIAHGGEDAGVVHSFRRETLIRPDGTRLQGFPVISGSVIRGSLRRCAAQLVHHAICSNENLPYGDGRLPARIVHALRTGGSLRATGDVLTGERQALLRDAIPMLGVFGLTAGGRVMSGRAQIDKAVPITTETQHLAPHYGVDLVGYTLHGSRSFVDREVYTRVADVTDASTGPHIDEADQHDIPKGSGQMRWKQEVLPMGTRLFHSISVDEATNAEQSFMLELVARWSRRATIGGQSRIGLGRVQTDYAFESTDIIGDPADIEPCDWRAHMDERTESLTEALTWL